MNPYLENPELWSEVHSRWIVALAELFGEIADEIALPLRPNYYVAIEKRAYMAEPDDSVLVEIPDVSVFSKSAVNRQGDEAQTATAILPSAPEPLTVMVPLMEEMQERYLEIRKVKTGAVSKSFGGSVASNGRDQSQSCLRPVRTRLRLRAANLRFWSSGEP